MRGLRGQASFALLIDRIHGVRRKTCFAGLSRSVQGGSPSGNYELVSPRRTAAKDIECVELNGKLLSPCPHDTLLQAGYWRVWRGPAVPAAFSTIDACPAPEIFN